jgi:hypothetical protein
MDTSLATQFEADLRSQVLSELPHDAKDRGSLDRLPTGNLLIRYFNWLRRLVPQCPRQLLVSTELAASPKRLDHVQGFDLLSRTIAAGGDLTPYLSRGVLIGWKLNPGKPLKAQRDLDLLVSDWGVHHLHLGTTLESDGFIARADDLLFAVFTPNSAYALDILPHGSWHKRHLLEVIARNWPGSGLLHELKGVAMERPLGEAQSKQLRQGGVSSPVEIDGRTYFPKGFLSMAGTSLWATDQSNQIMHAIRQVAEAPRLIEDAVKNLPEQHSWRFIFHEGAYGVLEQTTGTFVRLGDLSLLRL